MALEGFCQELKLPYDGNALRKMANNTRTGFEVIWSMGPGEVSLSLPAVINRCGVARVLSIPLNEAEKQALQASAETLKAAHCNIGYC